MAAQGRDIKLSTQRVEGYRNFGTKLWNAARFCEMSGARRDPDFDPIAARVTINRWIAGEVARTRDAVTGAIEEHRYNDAAGALYGFVWNVFCDWYVELIKPVLSGSDEAAKSETQHCAQWVLDQILLLLHPFMPFVTEELWQKTGAAGLLIAAEWPSYRGLGDRKADAEMSWVIEFISQVRSVRAEMNVPAGAKIDCVIVGASTESRRRTGMWEQEIMRLARLKILDFHERVPASAAQVVLGEAVIALPLAGVIDFAAERARLSKELEKVSKDLAVTEARLTNQGFIAKAPEEVLEETRERKAALAAQRVKLNDALKRLG
jgi:valyl-tRNA synthetase